MKRFSILLLVFVMVVAATVAFANEPDNDGVLIWGATGDDYNNTTLNRKGYLTDTNGSGQTAQLNVEALAYIPCYLKMVFNGNEGITSLESFGPSLDGKGQTIGSIPSTEAGQYHMIFDNEVGGFVDGNWNALGTGRNIEIAPGDDVYIQACDVFQVKIFSNDDFKYDVISSPLTNGSATLNLEMGTSSAINGTFDAQTFDSANKTVNIGTGVACDSLNYFHRFRVPYALNAVHGQYSGTITFKAYTI